jgi:hypothetical protein
MVFSRRNMPELLVLNEFYGRVFHLFYRETAENRALLNGRHDSIDGGLPVWNNAVLNGIEGNE